MNQFRAESLQKISLEFPHLIKTKFSGKKISEIFEIVSKEHPITMLNLFSTICGNVAKDPSIGHNMVSDLVTKYVNNEIDFKEFKAQSLLALISVYKLYHKQNFLDAVPFDLVVSN